MRCVWENNEWFFCHNSRPKKQRGVMCYESCSSFATNTSVVMKAGSLLSVEMQRKSEGKACVRVCVCVSLCWWQWECLFLGPPPPLQIYSTSLPNAELRSPAPPTARPNTHSVFFILSFSQSHSSLCSLSSSWPRLPLALPARELETYRNEAVERERRDRVRHVGTHVTEVSGAGEGRRLYTVPTRRVTREETKGAEF